jgi:hypothetical protein
LLEFFVRGLSIAAETNYGALILDTAGYLKGYRTTGRDSHRQNIVEQNVEGKTASHS